MDIIENEVKKQIETRKTEIVGILMRKFGIKQQNNFSAVKDESELNQQQPGKKPFQSSKNQGAQQQQHAQQNNVYQEKKSWEYKYNYEGMDQKMIEQRKRRIALKQMFERLMLGEDGPPQQPAMHQPPIVES